MIEARLAVFASRLMHKKGLAVDLGNGRLWGKAP
jgi:hypothetical protein